ncbi:GTPase HflX [Xanthomonas perforans]|uniref:GTPase HflX n=8 Tax=Xanthomonas TaxID=338 RepID=A0A0G9E0Y6_XANPE|nr:MULTISPECIES: ribosome rescue GTPase HflX [Xanthomonas]MBO9748122.1 GTPase HflX [Xanthomonas phaseoli pv. dieffenbachiae]MBO9877608.1 GTPase HflX [Xanthomonas sp. D-99]MBO9890219.1 GTPase HflX [Xanthomonas sp. D-36-1]MBV6788820.1 GTPase HflX [Xanthomonas campestris pv. clerodendri]MBV6794254.1 GTPase HflX [Xanthomonas campestris pv. daturae]MBV6831004.1 GTPase HflX [Xanthomonas campestris pv. viegasii]MBV6895601.1 GTPase HflX [Xanthomonas campestris pv. ionidii]MCP3047578.1 GTPase HflX [
MFDRSRKGEHALLIQTHSGGPAEDDVMEEFADLAKSAGATVAATLTARIDKPSPSTLIGSGKLEEVKAAAEATGADLVLVNHTLSPGQERNLERYLERRVIDRTGLILDIFAQRARSHEGKLQVELAQLRHMATRLVRGWTHLERQRGGSIGLRGPGETQLETDRRLLQKRVEQLQQRLEKVEVQRTQMRRARMRSELPRIALVGYTNAGKSTLFNVLTGAEAYVADQLFATLDPTVRRIALPGGSAILADTVGFVRDLPHELVAAFRSTLSEARDADLLLHVVDAADPLREERILQVDEVLQAVGAGDLPQLLVFNKIDKIEGAEVRHDAQDGIPDPARRERVWVSARDGRGLEELQHALGQRLDLRHLTGQLRLPPSAGRLRSRLHQLEVVRNEQSDEEGWLLEVDLPMVEAERLAAGQDGAPLRAMLPDRREDWEA